MKFDLLTFPQTNQFFSELVPICVQFGEDCSWIWSAGHEQTNTHTTDKRTDSTD